MAINEWNNFQIGHRKIIVHIITFLAVCGINIVVKSSYAFHYRYTLTQNMFEKFKGSRLMTDAFFA